MLAKFAHLFDKKQVKSGAIFVVPSVQPHHSVVRIFLRVRKMGKLRQTPSADGKMAA
jgi:hypothetical protein